MSPIAVPRFPNNEVKFSVRVFCSSKTLASLACSIADSLVILKPCKAEALLLSCSNLLSLNNSLILLYSVVKAIVSSISAALFAACCSYIGLSVSLSSSLSFRKAVAFVISNCC